MALPTQGRPPSIESLQLEAVTEAAKAETRRVDGELGHLGKDLIKETKDREDDVAELYKQQARTGALVRWVLGLVIPFAALVATLVSLARSGGL